jgi:beta-lactamase class A
VTILAMRRGWQGVVVVGLVVATIGPVSAASGQAAASAPRKCGVMFPSSYAAALDRQFPGQRVTASVYDTKTHCWYHLHRTMRITTASVIKAQVLGAVLLRAQDEHRGLTQRERDLIHPMIEYSLNEPYVSDLYADVGGVAGMDSFDRRMHATHTTNTLEYGATVTTANDRTQIALRMLSGHGPLRRAGRMIARHYMHSVVHPTQRWGITAGVPHGWSVALKNGFYPFGSHGWRVGSTGFVRNVNRGGGYAITIMTDQDTSQHAGIRLVERVSRHVARRLTNGRPKPRVVARAVCTRTSAGESWPDVARRVGVPESQWPSVRLVSGGNPEPLSGQRACSPRLKRR